MNTAAKEPEQPTSREYFDLDPSYINTEIVKSIRIDPSINSIVVEINRDLIVQTIHLDHYLIAAVATKYEKHARKLLYRISVYHLVPPFIINKGDLPNRLRKELSSYYGYSRGDILKAAVGRIIFQNINVRYFIQSVKRLLKREIVD